ncbi:hypothetical protein Agub_g13709 [Astrephomene gubernaculifera]|uniref:Uncharacterized protein n=1 Tax=Astrephomene gubernaculifera TaxID=47775 RepID=A0AAD3E4P0_9CHLO|nr:hypothetical protein Agub_g13709 [Astrephomene gubernaculifera]
MSSALLLAGRRGWRPQAQPIDDLGPSTSAPTHFEFWPAPSRRSRGRRIATSSDNQRLYRSSYGGNPFGGRPSCPLRAQPNDNTQRTSPDALPGPAPSLNTTRNGGSSGDGSNPFPVRASHDSGRRSAGGGGGSKRRRWKDPVYDKPVVPLVRKADRDLLPGGVPNTPWRRLAYKLRLAPDLRELLKIYGSNCRNTNVWSPRHTALVAIRGSAILYPKAVAAATAAAAGTDNDVAAAATALGLSSQPPQQQQQQQQPPQPAIKAEATSLFERLATTLSSCGSNGKNDALRQVPSFHIARLLVAMAWAHARGEKCEALVGRLVTELLRCRGLKLAQVASAEPQLFGRLIVALAHLSPRDDRLWVELQRLTLAALLQGQAEAAAAVSASAAGYNAGAVPTSEGGGQQPLRLWGCSGAGSELEPAGGSEGATGRPQQGLLDTSLLPDCTTADLANLAFGFAAADRALPPLFAALYDAALRRDLPYEPDTLSRLLWAWARAGLPPGRLAERVVAAFRPLLMTSPARPLGRVIWALGMLGAGYLSGASGGSGGSQGQEQEHGYAHAGNFLSEAGEAIVRRRLVFGSPQELVNVVWGFSQLGVRVRAETQVAEEAQRQRRAAVRQEESAERAKPRGRRRRGPERIEEGGGGVAGSGGSSSSDSGGSGETSEAAGQQPPQLQHEAAVPWTGEVAAEAPTAAGPDAGLRQPTGRHATEEGQQEGGEGWQGEPRQQALNHQDEGAQAGSGDCRGAAAAADPQTDAPAVALLFPPQQQQPEQQGGSGSRCVARSAPSRTSTPTQAWLNGTAAADTPDTDDAGRAASVQLPAADTTTPAPLPSLRPLPLSAVLDAADARTQARASLPPPDPSTPLALYRYLAHSFLRGYTGSATRWSMSNSQLAVLAMSFARAGYGNKSLFYTLARMAVRRLASLTPTDLVLILRALTAVRIPHDGLLQAACNMVDVRFGEFTSRQLADVLWAVQSLQPHGSYVALVETLRRRRHEGGQRMDVRHRLQLQQQRQAVRLMEEHQVVRGVEEGWAVATAAATAAAAMEEVEAAAEAAEAAAAGVRYTRLPVAAERFHVPAHLLEDAEWPGRRGDVDGRDGDDDDDDDEEEEDGEEEEYEEEHGNGSSWVGSSSGSSSSRSNGGRGGRWQERPLGRTTHGSAGEGGHGTMAGPTSVATGGAMRLRG